MEGGSGRVAAHSPCAGSSVARLYEYQSKQLLRAAGIDIPTGVVARSPAESRTIAARLGVPVVVKAQVWETSRARLGGVLTAQTPEDAETAAAKIFSRFACECVLVEERVGIKREFFVGLAIDDRLRKPVLLLGSSGGSGVEQRASGIARLPLDVTKDPCRSDFVGLTERAGTGAEIADFLLNFWKFAKQCEARSVEINPLAITDRQNVVALDCRLSVDDYAVYRHPDLGIDIAREFARPASQLDRIAWQVEKDDYRGTFYFVEIDPERQPHRGSIGFHGCGGGGAMAALDAAGGAGLFAANFCDTSGSPPASKVYRAARIILSLSGTQGYFLCGSGVASQEQFHLARALVKAFREEGLDIPVVLRLGGNGEEQAKEIIERFAAESLVPVEVYQKVHSADFCARRLRELIDLKPGYSHVPTLPSRKSAVPARPYTFETRTGKITYDHSICADCETKACVKECVPQILTLENEVPVLNIPREVAQRGRCIECLACEVECWYQGRGGASISLPTPGLDEYRKAHGHSD
jgi:succinyl-CoA synthetase beta subunit